MKYDVIYKCGHEGEVDLGGKYSYREYKLEELKGCLCPECEKARTEARMKKEAEEKGLAWLKGSDKQIEWALRIRESALCKLNNLLENVERSINECKDDEETLKKLNKRKEDLLYVIEHESKQTSAAYFIDNRLYYDRFSKVVNVRRFLKNVIEKPELRDAKIMQERVNDILDKMHKKETENKKVDSEKTENKETENKKVDSEKTENKTDVERKIEVHPENQLSNIIISLDVNDNNDVVLKSEYNKSLIDTIHKMSIAMSWNGREWMYPVYKNCGTTNSVIAEIGNRLLEAGFAVVFPSDSIAKMAVSGNFEKYHVNAIFKNTKFDGFNVMFDRTDDNYSKQLMSIYKAKKLDYTCVRIPIESYKELEEFAETNNFFWTAPALEYLDEHKKSVITANPVHIEREKAKKPNKIEVDISDLDD